MFVLGLTGSIGMGKSTTAEMFRRAGVKVFDADAAVHALYEGEAAPLIEAAFPGTTQAGAVDRLALRERVLGDSVALAGLESIVHPLVARSRENFLNEARKSGERIVVVDVPLLLETGGERYVDAVVLVSAPETVQKARVAARPGMTPEHLAAILEKQMPDREKRLRSHFIIDTSRGFAEAERQVQSLLRSLAGVPGCGKDRV
ncbi:MAG TPA: dephospho-CoA kinase [Beijerinckia sp.]|jgi:dephospho-CoA kinase|nr:dephospho-CoA kinase [Beijerinckia sp.]